MLNDEITRKLAMLIEGECEGLGPLQAANKYQFSKQRYFQLRLVFSEQGAYWTEQPKTGSKASLPTHQ